jgi:general secretion pathway protein J
MKAHHPFLTGPRPACRRFPAVHPCKQTPAPLPTSGQASARLARGFTLLEVLLAVAIFSLVLVAIHMVFYGAVRLRNISVERVEARLPLEQALTIMKRDLANIVLPGGTLSGELQTTATSALGDQTTPSLLNQNSSVPGQSSPAFYTASGILDPVAPWGEVARVQYFLADPLDQAPGKELFRSVTRNLLPTLYDEPDHQFLMGGLESLFFYFFDGTQWREYWDSTAEPDKLPRAVKIELQLASGETDRSPRKPLELIVPLLVRAGTNDSAQPEGGGL